MNGSPGLSRIQGSTPCVLEQVFSREEDLDPIIHRAHQAPIDPRHLRPTTIPVRDLAFMAANGVRIAAQGHMPFFVATKAVYDTLRYLK